MKHLARDVWDALSLAAPPDWAFTEHVQTVDGAAAMQIVASSRTVLSQIQARLTGDGYLTTISTANGEPVLIVEEATS